MDVFALLQSVISKISLFFSLEFWVLFPERVFWLADAVRPYSIVLSLVLLTGVIYCFLRTKQIEEIIEEAQHEVAKDEEAFLSESPKTSAEKKWQRIVSHIGSDKESDWRLAILEADILLDEMVAKMGYGGETLGDRLKKAAKTDFSTIDKEWEAHTVRNRIAHEGADFVISQMESRRVIGLFEEVFKEFHYI